jgi:GNAT superfamily N-acetyltransferase
MHMATMTDPTEAMVSFQQALLDGEIRLQRGELDRDLFLHADRPTPDVMRLTYVRLDGRTVKAFVNAVSAGHLEGLPVFQLGVAVPQKYRNKGYAKSLLTAAIAEMKNGFSRTKISSFYVEGIVSVDNEPSKRASAATISSNPTPIIDEGSGLPALQYLRKIG